jgi:hypothetical protein
MQKPEKARLITLLALFYLQNQHGLLKSLITRIRLYTGQSCDVGGYI